MSNSGAKRLMCLFLVQNSLLILTQHIALNSAVCSGAYDIVTYQLWTGSYICTAVPIPVIFDLFVVYCIFHWGQWCVLAFRISLMIWELQCYGVICVTDVINNQLGLMWWKTLRRCKVIDTIQQSYIIDNTYFHVNVGFICNANTL
jgi:hypothetical protein